MTKRLEEGQRVSDIVLTDEQIADIRSDLTNMLNSVRLMHPVLPGHVEDRDRHIFGTKFMATEAYVEHLKDSRHHFYLLTRKYRDKERVLMGIYDRIVDEADAVRARIFSTLDERGVTEGDLQELRTYADQLTRELEN